MVERFLNKTDLARVIKQLKDKGQWYKFTNKMSDATYEKIQRGVEKAYEYGKQMNKINKAKK